MTSFTSKERGGQVGLLDLWNNFWSEPAGYCAPWIDEVTPWEGARWSEKENGEAHRRFYSSLYFHFGLTPPQRMVHRMKSRLTIEGGFEVHGNPPSPHGFTSNGWDNVFNRVARDHAPTGGGRWAFNISRLDEGVLKGMVVGAGGRRHRESEAHLKVLYVLGATVCSTSQLSGVPQVRLEFGPVWEAYGVPDQIRFRVASMLPLSERELKRACEVIAYNHSQAGDALAFAYEGDVRAGIMTITVRETAPIPPAPAPAPPTFPQRPEPRPRSQKRPQPPEAPTRPPEPAVSQTTSAPIPQDDGFPYEFYRGIGLIDDEDMVLVPTILGSVRVHMTNEEARKALLNYRP